MLSNIPDGGQGGHLYKFATVLGTFIAIAAIYGACSLYVAHDVRIRENTAKLFTGADANSDARKFWLDYLKQKRDDVRVGVQVLTFFAAAGIGIAIAGAWHWYFRVQKFEDNRRFLENERLARELKAG